MPDTGHGAYDAVLDPPAQRPLGEPGQQDMIVVMKNLLILSLGLMASAASADPPLITSVSAQDSGSGWRFDVTLSHPDTGWEHYADGWRVLDMEGNELGMRVLFHPHVEEQPFTRSLGNVQIPAGVRQVQIQARCLVDGWAQETRIVSLD